jgi:predicted DNA-binding protein
MAVKAVSATIDKDLAEKLEKIAKETNRKKSYYINAALQEYFEAIEDFETALERKGGSSVSLQRAVEELGL